MSSRDAGAGAALDHHDGETPNWRNRRLQGGDWSTPAEAKDRQKRADKTLSVRLTEAELAEFDAQIATLGLNQLGGGGVLESATKITSISRAS